LITIHQERDPEFMAWLHRGPTMMVEFRARLLAAGIEVVAFSSYEKLDELRLVANVVKHGGGESAEKLFERAPLLFIHPFMRDDPLTLRRVARPPNPARPQPPRLIDRPLAGGDVYVTPPEFAQYAGAAMGFWVELADAISASRAHTPRRTGER
jgi:hypothetical protein